MASQKSEALLAASLCAGICVLLFADLGKPSSLVLDRVMDLGHVPLFAVVAGVALWSMDRQKWIRAGRKAYVAAFAACAATALATEIVQLFVPGRSFQMGDILNDLIGAGSFLLLAYRFTRDMPERPRMVLSMTVLFSLTAALLPVVWSGADEFRSRKDFPQLGSFETSGEMARWRVRGGSFRRVDGHATHGQRSLEVALLPGLYPGIAMEYPPRDWRGYDTLVVDAFLAGETPLALTVRVNDRQHNDEYTDRYNKSFALRPGPNRIVVRLADVARSPRGRTMDMGDISMLCIFSCRLQGARTVYFDRLRLEKKGCGRRTHRLTAPGTPP